MVVTAGPGACGDVGVGAAHLLEALVPEDLSSRPQPEDKSWLMQGSWGLELLMQTWATDKKQVTLNPDVG